MAQNLITALLVVAAFAYAVWTLMPASWQRQLRRWLGRPAPQAGSGCGGCGGDCASPVRPPAPAVIRLHRRAAKPDAAAPNDRGAGPSGR